MQWYSFEEKELVVLNATALNIWVSQNQIDQILDRIIKTIMRDAYSTRMKILSQNNLDSRKLITASAAEPKL